MTGLNGQILVDTSVMVAKADELSGSIRKVEESFQDIQTMVAATGNYWLGEAGDHYRALFAAEKEEIETVLRRLKEHPVDLKTMAQGYETAENLIRNENMQLQSDYI